MSATKATSNLKTAANRLNSRKSTGPKTLEGKATVAMNAIRHGLLSKACLMPGEDKAALDALRAELLAAVGPVGAIEELLADQLVSVVWRLKRAQSMEAGVLSGAFFEYLTSMGIKKEQVVAQTLGRNDAAPVPLVVGAVAAGSALRKDQAGAGALDRAARYGGALERSLFRTLHELERLQAGRKGQTVPLPIALDVTVEAPAPGPH